MKNNRKRDFISARDFRWFTWTLTLIFSLLRSFILKITSPNNSEDHSFYKHFKRFAVRPLSDLKLPHSAGVLKSYLKLFKILKTAQLLSKFSNSLSKWAFKKLWMSKYSHLWIFSKYVPWVKTTMGWLNIFPTTVGIEPTTSGMLTLWLYRLSYVVRTIRCCDISELALVLSGTERTRPSLGLWGIERTRPSSEISQQRIVLTTSLSR